MILNFCFKENLKNFSNIVNELILTGIHFIIFIMSLKEMKDYFEVIKKTLLILIAISWASNSIFTLLTIILGIIEWLKSKLERNKVLPQDNNEKGMVISNLET